MNFNFSVPTHEAPTAIRRERNNVARPAVAQALAGANSTVVYATGAVVGDMLAPTKALATLPVSVFVVGMALCTLPAGVVAQRYGRRTTFLLGAGSGVLAGLNCAPCGTQRVIPAILRRDLLWRRLRGRGALVPLCGGRLRST